MLNRYRIPAALVAVAWSFAVAAQQTVGFATLQPGTLLNAQASVIAKVVQDNSKLQVRVIGHGGDTGIIDAVNSKQADFLLLDVGEPAEAQKGENVWKGNAKPNIRAALTLFGFQMAFWVRKDSPVQSIADLKGKNIPTEWVQQTSVITHLNALLAAGGVTLKDVKSVPTVNVIRASEDFKSGRIDVFFFAVGAPKVQEISAAVGGLRVLQHGNPAGLGEADEGDPPRVLLLHRQPGAAHRRRRQADQGADHRLHRRRRHPRAGPGGGGLHQGGAQQQEGPGRRATRTSTPTTRASRARCSRASPTTRRPRSTGRKPGLR